MVGGALIVFLTAGCGGEPAALPAAAPTTEQVGVARVVDGDTFATTDGRLVHVLGIESCELGTPRGGEAVAQATSMLRTAPGGLVELRPETGPDALPTGELLRAVRVGAVDYAEQMLPPEHTGVGTGDVVTAVPVAYLSTLRTLDTQGSTRTPPVDRDCEAAPAPTTTTTTTSRTTTTTPATGDDDSDRDRPYVPTPPRRTQDDSRSGSGSSSRGGSSSGGDGHPCLPGERDGDKDGLCGES